MAPFALSLFDAIYKFILAHRGSTTPVALWKSVAKELMAMIGVTPLLLADAGRGWCRKVVMCDASWFGAGLVETEATIEELIAEAQLTAPKGWFIDLERETQEEVGHLEQDDNFEKEDGEPTRHCEDSLPPLPSMIKIVVVAHLFSSRRRPDDFEDFLTQLGRAEGILIIVVSIDTIIAQDYDWLDSCRAPLRNLAGLQILAPAQISRSTRGTPIT